VCRWNIITTASVKQELLTGQEKIEQREITPKTLMQELWSLCMRLLFFKLYLYIKFHFNSIGRKGVIFQTKKADKGE